jgi:hypothetical protein
MMHSLRCWAITRAVAPALIGACCHVGGAHAGAPAQLDPPAVYTFAIASQPLESALQELARQSGMQIIYFSQLTDGLHAPALTGRYTITAALRLLLSESSLTFRILNARTIEIRARSREQRP